MWGTNVQGRILAVCYGHELVTYAFPWGGGEQQGSTRIGIGSDPKRFFATLPTELFTGTLPPEDEPRVHVAITVRVLPGAGGGVLHDVLPLDIAPWRRCILMWTISTLFGVLLPVVLFNCRAQRIVGR